MVVAEATHTYIQLARPLWGFSKSVNDSFATFLAIFAIWTDRVDEFASERTRQKKQNYKHDVA